MRIGLLGGSFNPAHAAHRHISLTALKRLRLDQVWWLVTPGNPLKAGAKQPSLEKRVAAARKVAHHSRIVVTGFEGARKSAYTVDTLKFLKHHFPGVHFVWLMGADNLAELHHWRDWPELFRLVPVAVFDRPGFLLTAMASRAAQRFQFYRVDDSDAPGLASQIPPAWAMLSEKLSSLSSTSLRGERGKAAKEPAKTPATRKVAKSKS
jgi:nicotinate-nucleotide adenylyltransferase